MRESKDLLVPNDRSARIEVSQKLLRLVPKRRWLRQLATGPAKVCHYLGSHISFGYCVEALPIATISEKTNTPSVFYLARST